MCSCVIPSAALQGSYSLSSEVPYNKMFIPCSSQCTAWLKVRVLYGGNLEIGYFIELDLWEG